MARGQGVVGQEGVWQGAWDKEGRWWGEGAGEPDGSSWRWWGQEGGGAGWPDDKGSGGREPDKVGIVGQGGPDGR